MVDPKEKFSVGNRPRKYELKAALANCKKVGDSENTYYNPLKKIWDELQHLMQLPTFEATTLTTKKEKKSKFINSLWASMIPLMVVRSSITQEEPLPKIKIVFVMICKEEQQRNLSRVAITKEENWGGVDFVVTKAPPNLTPQRPTCAQCHKQGHDMSNCCQLHGFPQWWNERNKSSSTGLRRGRGDGRAGERGGGAGMEITKLENWNLLLD